MAGTNYNEREVTNVFISLTNEDNLGTTAQCIGDPNIVALQSGKYTTGCIMRRMDLSSGYVLYQNVGSVSVPVWTHLGALIGQTSGVISDPQPGSTNETWLGYHAGFGGSSTDYTVFLGINAGAGTDSSNKSVFIGYNAGSGATNASFSVFSGYETGLGALDAARSSFIGHSAGKYAISSYDSTFIGYEAGYNFDYPLGIMEANNSMFLGYQAGYNAQKASNSIFLGQRAGFNDTVDNQPNIGTDWSILIGPLTNTGGFSNSIVLGGNTSNTMANELYIADNVIHVNLAGVHYTLPTVQGGPGTVLTNDGAGNLSWA